MSESQIDIEKNVLKKKKYMLWGCIILIIIAALMSFNKYNNNKNYDINFKEGEKLLSENKFKEAREYYNIANKYKNDSVIKERIDLSHRLELSLYKFNEGTKLLGEKDYDKAYAAFKEVTKEDTKRFNLAQTKASESLKLYIDDQVKKANQSASKGDFDSAIFNIDLLLDLDSNNTNAKKLKKKYEEDLNKQEKEQEEQRKQKHINEIKNTIRVSSIYSSPPNSAGGVDFHIIWTNKSNKAIKYATFEVVPYNAVGDVQYCEIRHSSNFKGQVTGPVNPGVTYGQNNLWEAAWYNNTIQRVSLVGIEIIYMDGSTTTINGDDVQYVLY
ncbi:tetratricopeptide (TPR) repeat protein [Clostridium pascui]|uniref:tetratricopeptide repeat protein n=1 Tax=Clostridium pascui TaxID=46609 RepID=UPI00195AABF8|nr:hypothetical protein [Clostridium pascui]MBM7869219.1 tetratricopeptide (TPR) repeat protein [Clostridium pascui]